MPITLVVEALNTKKIYIYIGETVHVIVQFLSPPRKTMYFILFYNLTSFGLSTFRSYAICIWFKTTMDGPLCLVHATRV